MSDNFENKRLLVTNQLKILFSLQSISHESGAAIKDMQNTIQGCLTALEQSEVYSESPFSNSILVFMFSSKLPKQTLSLWEQSIQSQVDLPTWEDFNAFLVQRYRTLERIEDVSSSGSSQMQTKPSRREPISKRVNSFEATVNPKLQTCKLCSKENHPIRLCPKFVQMSVNERSNTIKQHKLCLNCFARGHQLKDCTSAHNCHTCKGRHNTLLHRPQASTPPTVLDSSSLQSTSNQPQARVQNYFSAGSHSVLLGTAVIHVCHRGIKYTARALIDSGSEATFISERLFKMIQLPYQRVEAQVSGLNEAIAAQPQKLCQFYIGSPIQPRVQVDTSA